MKMPAELLKALQSYKEGDTHALAIVHARIREFAGSMESVAENVEWKNPKAGGKDTILSVTPLGYALLHGHTNLALSLLREGANVTAKNVSEAARSSATFNPEKYVVLVMIVNYFTSKANNQITQTELGSLAIVIGTKFLHANNNIEAMRWYHLAAGHFDCKGIWYLPDIGSALNTLPKVVKYYADHYSSLTSTDLEEVNKQLSYIVSLAEQAFSADERKAIQEATGLLAQKPIERPSDLVAACNANDKKCVLQLLNAGADPSEKGLREAAQKNADLLLIVNYFIEYSKLKKIQPPDTASMGEYEGCIAHQFAKAGMREEEIIWFQRAEGRGNHRAMWNLALRYEHRGKEKSTVKKDLSKAVDLYKRSYPLWENQKDRDDVVANLQRIVSLSSASSSAGEEKKAEENFSAEDKNAIYEANVFLIKIYIEKGDLVEALGCIDNLFALDKERAKASGKEILGYAKGNQHFSDALDAYYGWNAVNKKAPIRAAAAFETLATAAKENPSAAGMYYIYRARALYLYAAQSEISNSFHITLQALQNSYACSNDPELRKRPVQELVKWVALSRENPRLNSDCWDAIAAMMAQYDKDNPESIWLRETIEKLLKAGHVAEWTPPEGIKKLRVILVTLYHGHLNFVDEPDILNKILAQCELVLGDTVVDLKKQREQYCDFLRKAAEVKQKSGDVNAQIEYLRRAEEQNDYRALMDLSDIHYKHGETLPAIECLAKSAVLIEGAPSSGHYWRLVNGVKKLCDALKGFTEFEKPLANLIIAAVNANLKLSPGNRQAGITKELLQLLDRIDLKKEKDLAATTEKLRSTIKAEQAKGQEEEKITKYVADPINGLKELINLGSKAGIDQWIQKNFQHFLNNCSFDKDRVKDFVFLFQNDDGRYAIAELKKKFSLLERSHPGECNNFYSLLNRVLGGMQVDPTVDNDLNIFLKESLFLINRIHLKVDFKFVPWLEKVAAGHVTKHVINADNRKLALKVRDNIIYENSKNNPRELKKLAEKKCIPALCSLADIYAKSTSFRGKHDKVPEALSLYLYIFTLLQLDSPKKIAEMHFLSVKEVEDIKNNMLASIARIMTGKSTEYTPSDLASARDIYTFALKFHAKGLSLNAETSTAAAAAAAGTVDVPVEEDAHAVIYRATTKMVWEYYEKGIKNAMGVKLGDLAFWVEDADEFKAVALEGSTVVGGGADARALAPAAAASAPPQAAVAASPHVEETGTSVEGVLLYGESEEGQPNLQVEGGIALPHQLRGMAPARPAFVDDIPPAAAASAASAASAPPAELPAFAGHPATLFAPDRAVQASTPSLEKATLSLELRNLSAEEQQQRAEERAALAVQGMQLPKASQEEGAGEKEKAAKKDLQMTVVVVAPGGPKAGK